MKLWSEFIPLVSMRLPECPIWTIEDAARRAAIDFFETTRVWRDIAPITVGTTVADQAAYTVATATAEIALAGVCEAWVGTRRIKESRNPEHDNEDVDSDLPVTGEVERIFVASASTVYLRPIPSSAGEVVKACLAYKPTVASTGIDTDAMFEDFKDAIEERIVEKCKAHRGKPWSDPAGAREAANEYVRLCLKYGGKGGARGQRMRQRRQVI